MAARLTINGVVCGIHSDSGVVEGQPDSGPEATVVYQCPYSQRYDLLKGLMPQAYYSGGFVRPMPHAYPPSPNLYCLGVPEIRGVAPWTDEAGWLQYRMAHVTADYRVPQYQMGAASDPGSGGVDPSGQPWTTTTFDVNAEIVKLPGSGYVLVPSGEPLDEQVRGLPLANVGIRMKRHWVPRIPLALVIEFASCCNSHPMKFADYLFPPGTLLFMGIGSQQQVDVAGRVVSEMDYILMGRAQGIEWNAFPASDGTWKLANTAADGSGYFPFPYKDLRMLP